MDAVVTQAKNHPVQDIDTYTDTRDYLAHARRDAERKGFADWLIADIDAHHVESVSWAEVTAYIEDPVVRHQATMYQKERVRAPPYGLNGDLGLRYQDVGGRIPHQSSQREKIEETDVHRDVVLTRRAMHGLAVDYMVLFPTPMLVLGMHPQTEMEVFLSRGLQSLARRTDIAGRPGHRHPRGAAVQHPRRRAEDGRGIRRRAGGDRLLRHFHALQAGACQRVHEACTGRSS